MSTVPSVEKESYKSRFRGVYRCGRRWKAQLQSHGIQFYLGMFDTEEEAARAYDRKAREEKNNRQAINFADAGDADHFNFLPEGDSAVPGFHPLMNAFLNETAPDSSSRGDLLRPRAEGPGAVDANRYDARQVDYRSATENMRVLWDRQCQIAQRLVLAKAAQAKLVELQRVAPEREKESILSALGEEIVLLAVVKAQLEEAVSRCYAMGLDCNTSRSGAQPADATIAAHTIAAYGNPGFHLQQLWRQNLQMFPPQGPPPLPYIPQYFQPQQQRQPAMPQQSSFQSQPMQGAYGQAVNEAACAVPVNTGLAGASASCTQHRADAPLPSSGAFSGAMVADDSVTDAQTAQSSANRESCNSGHCDTSALIIPNIGGAFPDGQWPASHASNRTFAGLAAQVSPFGLSAQQGSQLAAQGMGFGIATPMMSLGGAPSAYSGDLNPFAGYSGSSANQQFLVQMMEQMAGQQAGGFGPQVDPFLRMLPPAPQMRPALFNGLPQHSQLGPVANNGNSSGATTTRGAAVGMQGPGYLSNPFLGAGAQFGEGSLGSADPVGRLPPLSHLPMPLLSSPPRPSAFGGGYFTSAPAAGESSKGGASAAAPTPAVPFATVTRSEAAETDSPDNSPNTGADGGKVTAQSPGSNNSSCIAATTGGESGLLVTAATAPAPAPSDGSARKAAPLASKVVSLASIAETSPPVGAQLGKGDEGPEAPSSQGNSSGRSTAGRKRAATKAEAGAGASEAVDGPATRQGKRSRK